MRDLRKTIFVIGLLVCGTGEAKIHPPKAVPPIIHHGIQYSTHYSDVSGTSIQVGEIVASDRKTKQVLWKTEVFKKAIDQDLERDVQLVFFTGLELKKDVLKVKVGDREVSLKLKTGERESLLLELPVDPRAEGKD